jgi:hypothetical protein
MDELTEEQLDAGIEMVDTMSEMIDEHGVTCFLSAMLVAISEKERQGVKMRSELAHVTAILTTRGLTGRWVV